MESRVRPRKLAWLLTVLASVAAPVAARVVEIDVERASLALGRFDRLALSLDWPDGASEGALELRAAVLDAAELGYRFRDLRWNCALQQPATDAFRCVGPIRARDAGSAVLQVDWNAQGAELTLSRARGQFLLALPSADDAPVRLQAERLPLAWLQPLLAARWAEGRLTGGTLDATLDLRAGAAGGSELAGPVRVDDLGIDSRDGRIAAAAIDGEGTFLLALRPKQTAVELDLTLTGGELLLGALYAALPSSPVELGLAMQSNDAGGWSLSRLKWSDPGTLVVGGSATLGTDAALSALDMEFSSADIGAAHARYFDAWLATLGLPELAASGALEGSLAMRDAALLRLDAMVSQVGLKDGAERFAFEGLDGALRWSASGESLDSELAWSAARVGAIGLGPITLPLRSAQRGLSLREAVEVDVLGGRLRLPRLAWTPAEAELRGTRLDLALELQNLDVARLSQAFEWPAFSGTLSGRIPGVSYADEVLTLQGGLEADVFGGRVEIASMTLERPFGVAPTTSADVDFDNLDLRPLTSAFGFGEITGRLDGQVRGLRLLDWSPVAFDAQFRTDADASDDRRISQRAVNDLTRVGGGGIAAGLQNQVLKLFDTFGYRRIGLSCRLLNNVCTMGGIDSSGTGYTIVEGSGLPRVSVIGHQRQVDWPVLVARLQAATQGQTPIVE
jgi:hypothetical protein